jgi:hypothetical protein
MPSAEDFLKDFKVYIGIVLPRSGFKVNAIKIDHIPIVKFKKYQYPMMLSFTYQTPTSKSTSSKLLIEEFSDYIKGDKVIYSQFGNPYRCWIEKVQLADQRTLTYRLINVTALGFAQRIPHT